MWNTCKLAGVLFHVTPDLKLRVLHNILVLYCIVLYCIVKQRGLGRDVPSGRSEPSLSTDIPWGRRGWLVMLGSSVYNTGSNGCWNTVWWCETDGELDGAGSAPSLPWLLSERVRVVVCGLVFASGVGVEVLAFVTSSSLVFLSGLLLCEQNRTVRIKSSSVKKSVP